MTDTPDKLPALEAVAVIRFNRAHPENENEMPKVISCNWHTDGEYVLTDLNRANEIIAGLEALVEQMAQALEPFAECAEQIQEDEDDEEWAKFRLLIKYYRAADKALAALNGDEQ